MATSLVVDPATQVRWKKHVTMSDHNSNTFAKSAKFYRAYSFLAHACRQRAKKSGANTMTIWPLRPQASRLIFHTGQPIRR